MMILHRVFFYEDYDGNTKLGVEEIAEIDNKYKPLPKTDKVPAVEEGREEKENATKQ